MSTEHESAEELRRIQDLGDRRLLGLRMWALTVLSLPIPDEEKADMIARVLRANQAIIENLSQQAEDKNRNYRLAHIDTLTQLPNRRYFDLAYQELIDSGEPFAVVSFDIDDFKRFNTLYGDRGGDQVLVQLGIRLSSNVRQVVIEQEKVGFLRRANTEGRPDVATRTGGEEFTVLLPGVRDINTLMQRADEIRQAIASPNFIVSNRDQRSVSVPVTISLGAGIYRQGDGQAFLDHVVDARNLSKKLGKNRVSVVR